MKLYIHMKGIFHLMQHISHPILWNEYEIFLSKPIMKIYPIFFYVFHHFDMKIFPLIYCNESKSWTYHQFDFRIPQYTNTAWSKLLLLLLCLSTFMSIIIPQNFITYLLHILMILTWNRAGAEKMSEHPTCNHKKWPLSP